MHSTLTIDGVTVHGTASDMNAAYDAIVQAMLGGQGGSFALDSTDENDVTTRQVFWITPSTRLSASFVYGPGEARPARQPSS